MATAPAKRKTAGKRSGKGIAIRRDAPTLTARQARALSHPLRIQIMQAIDTATEALSPSNIVERLGHQQTLPTVAYHIRMLEELGFIRLTNTKPRRGAIEHFYLVVEEEWHRHAPLRPGVVDVELGVMRLIVGKLATRKKFGDRDRIQFTTDGDELLLNLDGKRHRIFPDGTVVEEDETNGRKDGDQ